MRRCPEHQCPQHQWQLSRGAVGRGCRSGQPSRQPLACCAPAGPYGLCDFVRCACTGVGVAELGPSWGSPATALASTAAVREYLWSGELVVSWCQVVEEPSAHRAWTTAALRAMSPPPRAHQSRSSSRSISRTNSCMRKKGAASGIPGCRKPAMLARCNRRHGVHVEKQSYEAPGQHLE